MPKYEVHITERVRTRLRELRPDLTQMQRAAISRTLRNLAVDPHLGSVPNRTTTSVEGHVYSMHVLLFMRLAITISYHIVSDAVVVLDEVHLEPLSSPGTRL